MPEKFVTEANDKDMGSTVTDANDNDNDIGSPLPENFVTEAKDMGTGSKVTDVAEANDKDKGIIVADTNVNENGPVMDDDNLVGDDSGLHPVPGTCSEAVSHEAIRLFLNTGSSNLSMRKYKCLRNVTHHTVRFCHAPASTVHIYKTLFKSWRRVVEMLLQRTKLQFSAGDSQVVLVDRLQFMAGLAPTSKEWELLPPFMQPLAMDSTIACHYKCADAYDAIRCFYKTDSSLHMHKMKKYRFCRKDAGGC